MPATPTNPLHPRIAALPKAELHLHLEGSIRPATVVELAARYGDSLTLDQAGARYCYSDFRGFLEAFKWVTSYLRQPEDFELIVDRHADELISQNVVYAEFTVSIGVMLYYKSDPLKNFAAMLRASERALRKGLRLQWIFDAAWQFGPAAAVEVVRLAIEARGAGAVAFGMGGDELMFPYASFREAYELAASAGLRLTAHAGEVGDARKIRDAIELLGAERIGHGLAVMHDLALQDLLAERGIALEICPTSNICTGALASQLGRPSARIEEHPARSFLQRGVPVVLSTDDPAMFHTDLSAEYALAPRLGLTDEQVLAIIAAGFSRSFLATSEKESWLQQLRDRTRDAGDFRSPAA